MSAMDTDKNDIPCQVPSASTSKTKKIKRIGPSNQDKKYKKGIVYLSFIPPGMNVQILTQLLSKYGQLGRIMLQSSDNKSVIGTFKRKKHFKKREMYSEGWVEFLKKRTAKEVAAGLNNTQIGGKKKSIYHDYIWNIKYLSRFKWTHLSERISYERAVYKQRMHAEINQAKKMANHFIDKVEVGQRLEHIANRKKNQEPQENQAEKEWLMSSYFKQRETEEEKRANRKKKDTKNQNREAFLRNLFS